MTSSQYSAYFYLNKAKLSPLKLQYTFANVSNYESNCDIVNHNRKSLTELYPSSMLSVVTELAKVCKSVIKIFYHIVYYCSRYTSDDRINTSDDQIQKLRFLNNTNNK